MFFIEVSYILSYYNTIKHNTMSDNPKIFMHGCYVGTTGYNNHTRDFTRHLDKITKIKVRNFTVGKSWSGYSDEPHNGEEYLNDIDKKVLKYQTLWSKGDVRKDSKIYSNYGKDFAHDVNIVLTESNHHYFYDSYNGPKIAYNVWESTEQPNHFFNKLKSFDELWVPSKWQKECSIKQGYDKDKIQVVPEGVDVDTFFPEDVELLDDYKDGRFKFILFGRWDYRKSTKEIIECFLKTFSKNEPVDLILSIDNMWGERIDGFKTTEERLNYFKLNDERLKIKHFPSRSDYIKYLKTGHVFLSCARSEGWNLPLIEAMSCGTPSIYSNCSGQLEFAEGKGFPVKIIGERPATYADDEKYTMAVTTSEIPGNYYEPDFDDLCKVMRYVYNNYEICKEKSKKESYSIHENFNWDRVAEIGLEKTIDFMNRKEKSNEVEDNYISVSYVNGPRVEVIGDVTKNYLVEFIDGDSNEVIHNDVISNNMWTSCGRKYYTNWIVKVNDVVVSTFNPENKDIYISLDSSSFGDTLAWTPYIVEFKRKHNCNVIFSSFHNDWFEGHKNYEGITFVNPGSSVSCYAHYTIGWFRDDNNGWKKYDMYPNKVNEIPLQKTSSDILGLDYKEINYGVNFKIGERPIDNKYIVFGPQATAGCKEWSYNHWKELSKLLIDKGYSVVSLTKNPYHIDGVKNVYNEDINVVATYLHYSEFLIGLGSGMSWLNWSLDKFTYMINGFSEDEHEFKNNIKKINNDVCIRCWNDPVHIFDPGDWDWCPVYKGTPKQHICQKSITPLQVFNSLDI